MHCAYAPELGPDGAVLGLVAVITDVSERKRAEQALRASEQHLRALDRLEAVGRLAGGVAHEANNQMSVVLGMAAFVLRDQTLSPSVRQDVVYIKEAAERTAVVSQQLLAFSRQQITQLRVLDVNDVVRGFEPVLRRTMGEDVELRLELGTGIGSVRADPGQLEQMLLNLALNARDAMPRAGASWSRPGMRRWTRGSASGRTRRWSRGATPASGSATPARAWTRRRWPTSSSRSSPPRAWGRGPGSASRVCTASSSSTTAMST